MFITGNSKSKGSPVGQQEQHQNRRQSAAAVRKSLTQDLGSVKGVNQMAVQRDYNKPLTEEEPYIVQVRSHQSHMLRIVEYSIA